MEIQGTTKVQALRSKNEKSLEYLAQYKLDSQNNILNGSNYYLAKEYYRGITKYKKFFDINAKNLANAILDEVNKQSKQQFSLDIHIIKETDEIIKTKFYNGKRRQYDYALVLKYNDEFNTLIIPITQDVCGITSQNEEDFVFDKNIAMNHFENKTINLLDNNYFYIPNVEKPNNCDTIEQYNLDNFIWDMLAKQADNYKNNNIKIKQNDSKLIKDDIKTIENSDPLDLFLNY